MKKSVFVFTMFTVVFIFCAFVSAQVPETAKILFSAKLDANKDDSMEIFIMDSDGKNIRQLTNNLVSDGVPSWLPNSNKIVFGSNSATYTMDADGNNIQRLPDEIGKYGPIWSYNGKKIAFQIYNLDRNYEIYVADADGKNFRNLTSNPAEDHTPTLSPDGSKIAFVSNRNNQSGIYVMDIDGNNVKLLTDNHFSDAYPAWSPDGTRIAFASERDGLSNIYVMDADGKNQKRLTYNNTVNYRPSWSPDSKKIIFLSEVWIFFNIFVIDADGGNPINLTNRLENEWIAEQCWFDPAVSAVSSSEKQISLWGRIKHQ